MARTPQEEEEYQALLAQSGPEQQVNNVQQAPSGLSKAEVEEYNAIKTHDGEAYTARGKEIFPDTGGKTLVGTAALSALGAYSSIYGGLAYTANEAQKGITGMVGGKPSDNSFLKGFADENYNRAQDIQKELETRPGIASGIAKVVGSIPAYATGGAAIGGASAGASYVGPTDNLLTAGAKIGGGALAGKTLDDLSSSFFNSGRVKKAVSAITDKAQETISSGINLADDAFASAKDAIGKQIGEVFDKYKPQYESVMPDPMRWNSLKNTPEIQQVIKDLSKVSAGDSGEGQFVKRVFGDTVDAQSMAKLMDNPTVSQLDALKQFASREVFVPNSNKVKTASKDFKNVMSDLSGLLKDSSPAYAQAMKEAAPMMDAKSGLNQLTKSAGVVKVEQLVNTSNTAMVRKVREQLEKAGTDGSSLVEGYFTNQIGRSNIQSGEAAGTVLDKLIPSNTAFENLKSLSSGNDRAAIQAMRQAQLAIKDAGKSLPEKIPIIGSKITQAKQAIGLGNVAGDKAMVDSLEASTMYRHKTLSGMVNDLPGAEKFISAIKDYFNVENTTLSKDAVNSIKQGKAFKTKDMNQFFNSLITTGASNRSTDEQQKGIK